MCPCTVILYIILYVWKPWHDFIFGRVNPCGSFLSTHHGAIQLLVCVCVGQTMQICIGVFAVFVHLDWPFLVSCHVTDVWRTLSLEGGTFVSSLLALISSGWSHTSHLPSRRTPNDNISRKCCRIFVTDFQTFICSFERKLVCFGWGKNKVRDIAVL